MSALLARSDAAKPFPLAPRPLPGRTDAAAVDRPALVIRAISPMNLAEHADAIAALAGRALARNVFYESAFLVHAAHHLRDDGWPQIVSVWSGTVGGKLVGLFPIVAPRFGSGRARGWLSHFMADGTPLVDASCAEEVLSAFLASLAEGDRPAAGVLFPSIDADGPFAVLLRSMAAREGLPVANFDEHQRAVLRARDGAGGEARLMRAKKRKELLRQERRLTQAGDLILRSATDRAAVRDAFEHFLALEARGWKGRAGTAMMQDPAAAAFARSAMRALAGEGRCRIDLLELNGAPIAATIELMAGDRVSFWKTVYDETHARYSPGVQTALKLTRRHLATPQSALVDSCAEADHPMIDHLWPDRMRVVDLFVGTSPDRARKAASSIRREAWRRRARAFAKTAYRALRPTKMAF